MIFSECKNIFPALIKARSSVSEIVKDTKGNFGRYADLATINAAIMPALAAHDLTVVQEVSTDHDAGLWVIVETWLVHGSGEYIQFAPLSLPVGDKMTPQAVGSCITYGRRYALMAALNLSADDDDGQAATDNRASKPTTQQRPPLRSEAPPPAEVDMGMLPREVTKPEKGQLARFHQLGTLLYKNEWDERRHVMAEKVSKGATQSSKELSANEVATLIAGMEKKLHTVEEQVPA